MKKIIEFVKMEESDAFINRQGKTYPGVKVTFMQNGRSITKPIHKAQFENNKQLLEAIRGMVEGQMYEIETDDSTYKNWQSIKKSSATMTGNVGGRTDATQESIVFQNALGHAINLQVHKLDTQKTLDLAKVIADVAINPTKFFTEKTSSVVTDNSEEEETVTWD